MSSGDLSAVGKTAFAVSLARANEADREHPWFIDPLAVRLAASVPEATRAKLSDGLIAWVAVRTRFLDELVLQAAERGIRQVVIVGAGLDARAFRLALPDGFSIHEVDTAAVFAAKQRILLAAGLGATGRREVVADVLEAGWLDALRYAGWRSTVPTLWLLEGFLIYFNQDARTRILTQLAHASAPGSELGATVSMRTDMSTGTDASTAASADATHPLWKPFDGRNITGWLEECGWTADVSTAAEVSGRFGRPLPDAAAERVNGALVVARVATAVPIAT